jgi:hypothetical protein
LAGSDGRHHRRLIDLEVGQKDHGHGLLRILPVLLIGHGIRDLERGLAKLEAALRLVRGKQQRVAGRQS